MKHPSLDDYDKSNLDDEDLRDAGRYFGMHIVGERIHELDRPGDLHPARGRYWHRVFEEQLARWRGLRKFNN